MTVAAAMSAAVFGGNKNLIKNGDFETLLKDGHPSGYSRAPEWGGSLSSSSSFTATDEAYSGKHAGLYTCRNMGGFISYRNIALKPKTWYRFSGMIAADVEPVMDSVKNMQPSPGVFVKLMPQLPSDWKGPWPKVQQPRLYAGGGQSDWTHYEDYFQSDAVHTNMWIGIYIFKVDGVARFDDLELVEVSEAEALEWKRKQDGGGVKDGVNLVFNGSFEVACNDDMPDYIYSGIGAPWFTDRWTTKRIGSKDAPDGGHYLHAMYYMTEKIKVETNRNQVLSFFARSDKPGTKISANFNGNGARFTLSERWQRYSMPCKCGLAGSFVSVNPVNKQDEFDIDAVMLHYGEALAPYARHPDENFFAENDALQLRTGEKRNREFANVKFKGPLAVPAATKDGKVDFRYDTVFAGEGLVLRGLIPEAEREFEIKDSSGKVVWKGKVKSSELAKGVAVAKGLPVGEYALSGSKFSFRVVPAPTDKWCRVDRFSHMAMTEKGPYLPCAFSLAMSDKFLDRFDEIAPVGFNTVIVWGYGTVNNEKEYNGFDTSIARKVLDRLGKTGLEVVSFTPVMPAERMVALRNDKTIPRMFAWDIRETDFKTINDAKVGFVKAMMDHPSIRMWHYYDEVYGYWETGRRPKKESNMGDTYREARKVDPYRLHWNNSTFAGRLFGGAESTDITSATIYTIAGTRGANSSVSAGATLAKVGEKLGGKPGMAGIWLQFYAGHGEAGEYSREPSAEEMERMMYGCVLKGVRAFWYFSMRPRSNRLYFHTGKLAKELDSLKEVLAFGKPMPFACSHGDVEGGAWEYDGKLYVITSNSAYYPASGRINLPEPYRSGKAKVLFEDREIAFKDWTLEDNWNKLSRHVYVIEPVR